MEATWITKEFVRTRVPPRKRDSHKGMNGTLAVVGGSRIYHGAPFHTAMSALRTGLDLVYLAVPSVIATPIRAMSGDLIVYPLPDGKLTRGNANKLADWLKELDCIAIGPGLGPQNAEELAHAVRNLAKKAKVLVLDADALRPSIVPLAKNEGIKITITPHAGEFERLFSVMPESDLEARVEQVRRAAGENRMTILLKGPVDVISDGNKVGLNKTHSPSMTTGGTGDVLTGVTAGMSAKGMPPFDAACAAALINGLAGVAATDKVGLHLVATDLVDHLPLVMKEFDSLT